jgi:hypothetical protein
MGAEEQGYVLELEDGYLVDITYYADRVELSIRQEDRSRHPGQLVLGLDG